MSSSSAPSGQDREHWVSLGAAALLALLAVLLTPARGARAETPAGNGAAAASENALATQEALRQLQGGGNAIDAAIAAALVAGVGSPSSSGIGGGGFGLIWVAASQQCHVLDFREVAPAAVDPAAFEQRPFPFAERGRYVGVPGEVAGLYALHQRFGSRPWRELVTPAARLARSGFAANRHLARALNREVDKLKNDPGLAALLLDGRQRPKLRLRHEPLAHTLELIASNGPSAMYSGRIADELVKTVRDAGGALSKSDLERYKPRWREPLKLEWGGHELCTMPPPSGGGLMLAEVLKSFSRDELQRLGFNTGQYMHAVADTMRGALADRLQYVGDPDYVPVALPAVLGRERLDARKRGFRADATRAIGDAALDEHGTHALVTMDAQGNAVSLTTTINAAFGAKLATPSGIVLNDELDDFAARKYLPKEITLTPNQARGGARPVSSMTPTIATANGRVVLAAGGSGGFRIAPNVAQVVLSRLAFGHSAATAVRNPRFHVPFFGGTIELDSTAPPALHRDLQARGEAVRARELDTTAVQLIVVDADGRRAAAADPRKFGSGAVR